MIQVSPDSIADRFMRYVQVDTQSDPTSTAHPTTQKQKDDFRLLSQSIKNIMFVTYDELLSRLSNYIGVLEKHSSQKSTRHW